MKRLIALVVLVLAGCTAWPRPRAPRKNARLQKMLAEAVEAGREAARQQETPSSLFDLFLSSNTTKVQRKDWGRNLALAFENFRVPAALVAGTALSGAFALPPIDASDQVSVGVAKRLYLLLSMSSFMSSMITVALATSALVQLNDRDSGRDSSAENLEDYIARAGFELGRERWVAVNAHFIVGVITLCSAVGLRCYAAFADRAFGRIAAMLVASGTLTAISLGLPGGVLLSLSAKHMGAILRRAFDWRAGASPALLTAVLLTLAAAALTVSEFGMYVSRTG